MHRRKTEQRIRRTVRGKHCRSLLAVLLFLGWLVYICARLPSPPAGEAAGQTAGQYAEPSAGQYAEQAAGRVAEQTERQRTAVSEKHDIAWPVKNGTVNLTETEFLTGVLAACIPGHYSTETLKAQAVILRSLFKADGEATDFSYLDKTDRKKLWQDKTKEYEDKFTDAVQTTAGIILCYEGQVISPPYFRLSAGKTRDSAQIWEDKSFSWCKSVECPHNLEAAEYLQKVILKQKDVLAVFEKEQIPVTERNLRIRLVKDSTGYVMYAECNGQHVEGERFRQMFGLASAHISLEQEGEHLVFTTRGIGHGVGFDQYAAELLAQEGNDYQKLLDVFFEGVTLEKME